MSNTLAQSIADVRARLSEIVPTFYTDDQLTTWINEACADIARRTHCLETMTSATVMSGVKTVVMPSNLYKLHRVEFVINGNIDTYPLEIRAINDMDSIWGINQNIQNNYPAYCFVYGAPPGMMMTLFPVPSAAGQVNIYYARTATPAQSPSDTLDIPNGWDDAVSVYCEYVARRKAADPLWQACYQDYKDKLDSLIDNTASWHDQLNYVTTGRQMVPSWVYGGSWWGW